MSKRYLFFVLIYCIVKFSLFFVIKLVVIKFSFILHFNWRYKKSNNVISTVLMQNVEAFLTIFAKLYYFESN